MIICIASGKGGTGKTMLAVNLAVSLREEKEVQFLDCDVEEPNAHIFLQPVIDGVESVAVPVPVIDEQKCTYCGRCSEVCAFNALVVLKSHVMVFPELCHGCGGCAVLCPEQAITEENREIGTVLTGWSGKMKFVYGRLRPGEAFSLPVVKAVKRKMDRERVVIIDCPPGTSCPMVESVKGSDFAILVTEPTPFGLHDLKLAVEVVEELGIPAGVVINRADIGDDEAKNYCSEKGLPVLAGIPWDRDLATYYARGVPVANISDRWKGLFGRIFEEVVRLLS